MLLRAELHLLFLFGLQRENGGGLLDAVLQKPQLPFGKNIFGRFGQFQKAEGKIADPRRIAANLMHFSIRGQAIPLWIGLLATVGEPAVICETEASCSA